MSARHLETVLLRLTAIALAGLWAAFGIAEIRSADMSERFRRISTGVGAATATIIGIVAVISKGFLDGIFTALVAFGVSLFLFIRVHEDHVRAVETIRQLWRRH